MTVRKHKKVTKLRGHTTHARGSRKKGRGAGNRGGRGMAGSGKRAGQKKPTILTTFGNAYFGKHGFRRPKKTQVLVNAINLSQLQSLAKGSKEVDLTSLGYDKLLGSGKVTKPYTIKVTLFSKKAKEKIEKIGGSISN